MRLRIAAALLAGAVAAFAPPAVAAQSAHAQYTRTLARERVLRDAAKKPTLKELRAVVAAYERFARRYRSSGYTDNALWQAANVALLAHDRFGEASDRHTAVRLLEQLKAGYPASSLVPRARETLVRLTRPAVPTLPPPDRATMTQTVAETTLASPASGDDVVTIRDIRRTTLPDGVRVTIEMDGESIYRHERLDNPARVFFDLRGARPVARLQDATLRFAGELVREIRLGRHPRNTTRVVMDLQRADEYSVFTLYNPFRLVVDFRRAGVPPASVPALSEVQPTPESIIHAGPVATDVILGALATHATDIAPQPDAATRTTEGTRGESAVVPRADGVAAVGAPKLSAAEEKLPIASRPVTSPAVSPAVPTANSDGRFSLARQLGLGISRVVLDPGHGGHDPGARSNGTNEAELVLDVALRLRKLLEKQTGIEVAMTRDSDVFVPLEERTAFANRQGADLFLSIHANASVNSKARGVETYYLNFATNPEAEAVAARENSASARTMHHLPDIVRAIALNNKIDESRDFAGMVQKAMVRRLSGRNRQLRDLGVKQAPFVVLIGAGMPSVLAEISFITNKQEGQLLKTAAYRQQIADALLDAVLRYQQGLKNARKVASR
jgi:N-acetylmuramoyl-L-alanine amidase